MSTQNTTDVAPDTRMLEAEQRALSRLHAYQSLREVRAASALADSIAEQQTRTFAIRVDNHDEISGRLMANGLVHLRSRGSGLQGHMRPDGSDACGDLSYGPWAPYIATAVREHFGYGD